MRVSNRWIIGAITLVFLMIHVPGCGKGGNSEAIEPATTQVEGSARPTNVVVHRITTEDVEEVFTLPGNIEAWEDLTLSLEQSGPIRWIGPREGERLKKGEAILRIDPETLKSQHDKNQTEYDLKKKHLERVEQLLREELVSQKQYDDARLTFESAKASLTQSRIALEKSTLVSPIDGILDRLLVDRGEFGNIGTPAAVVVQVDRLKVIVDVPEKDVTATRVGQKVTVLQAEVKGAAGIGRPGKVIHVTYRADDMTRTYPTKIEMDNRDMWYRPGMIVRVRFIRRILNDVIAIPLYAIVDREGDKFIFVVENGMAVRRLVHLGPIVEGKAVIHGGIQVGEDLVVKGQQLLTDGGPVRLVKNGQL